MRPWDRYGEDFFRGSPFEDFFRGFGSPPREREKGREKRGQGQVTEKHQAPELA
jgi:hypothetical protein